MKRADTCHLGRRVADVLAGALGRPVRRRANRTLDHAGSARALMLAAFAALSATVGSLAYATCGVLEDHAGVTAARVRIAAHGSSVWPGWTSAPPVLISSGDCDFLVAHPGAPEGFEDEGDGVSRRSGHLLPALAATAWPVDGVWTVAMPARAELQDALDRIFGPGTLTLDAYMYERAITHEAFHAFQMTVLGGPEGFPRFDRDGEGEPPDLGQLAATSGYADSLRSQGRALADALRARTAGEAAAAVARFLEQRDSWRAEAPLGTAALERELEWTEGAARYADVRLALYPPTHPGVPADESWSSLLSQLEDPAAIPTGPRDAYAALGAGQAFALDRLYPGWKERALQGGAPLEDLLREAVAGGAGVPRSLSDLPVAQVRLGGEAWRVVMAQEAASWARGLQGVTSLGGLDGLLFAFPEDVGAGFWMRGAVMPLDVAFFDASGGWLASFSMPVCQADTCPVYRPEQPFRYALETLPGRLPDDLSNAGLDLGSP